MENRVKQIQKTFFALGTVNSILIAYEESMEEKIIDVLEQIKLKVQNLDNLLSVFKDTSEISQINEAAGKNLVLVSPDTYCIILKAVEYSKLSEGTFDITTRPLSKLWGIGKKGDFIPTIHEIRKTKKLVNYKDILIEENTQRIGLKKSGQAIDLGGIAKGYAADEAKRILLEHNISNAIINFGGTVIALGEGKKVGIQNPDLKTGTSIGVLNVRNQSVVTSGWYERYFIKDGKWYHHLIDPRTGAPTDNGLCSITVVGNSAMEMDALSTAVFVLGIEEGTKLLKRCETEGIFILKTQEVFITSGLQEQFKLINKQEAKSHE